ncbi:MAG TPA: HAMP domain-containing histidine kinase [Candidatus Mediterraneibacter excrementigallinarum]|nr:HAMP domain-containing histidine kinase [Candidatus Mediterraneibacter excrementigallinarum]
MRILVNRKIKRLFLCVLLAVTVFIAVSAFFLLLKTEYAIFCVTAAAVLLACSLFALMYRYFRDQSRIMNDAIDQIREYIDGNRNARIECDDEGDLYRLFHEVNTLVTILNAHAENEERAKTFMKDTISDISHQLRTPLAALNIYNGLLQEEVDGHPELREFTSLSEQELDRIETLVQNLLKITRLDAGTIVFEKSPENVSDMMSYIKRHFACRAEQEGKSLILSGDEEVELFCDRSWLTEAISNIVKNALDHTAAGAEIRITWRAFASVVQIIVSDDGSGIHPEDLPHIFKRFYRSRFSKDKQGIGLGLPLAKAIIEEHNGTVEVNSTLGVGTTFTVNFLIPTKL